ncbi:MAG: DUF1304 family protein [Pseudomonadota bacterium]
MMAYLQVGYFVLLVAVIFSHVVFAGVQAFFWPSIAKRLFDLTDPSAVEKTTGVSHSFASYNLSIAIGLIMSTRLQAPFDREVQFVVLALIVFTAVVGYLGTKSKIILFFRLAPAALALLALTGLLVTAA